MNIATSSIFKNFVISGWEEVENFVKMLDAEPGQRPHPNVRHVTDPDEINDFVKRDLAAMQKTAVSNLFCVYKRHSSFIRWIFRPDSEAL